MNFCGVLDGVNGVKTGFTGNAGRCLVTSCVRNNLNIITVVLGADTKKIRTSDSKELIDYIYENFEQQDFEKLINQEFNNWVIHELPKINIIKSNSKLKVKLSKLNNYIIPINKNSINSTLATVNSLKNINSPLKAGSTIGVIEIKNNAETILHAEIILDDNINKKSPYEYILEILSNYLNYFSFIV